MVTQGTNRKIKDRLDWSRRMVNVKLVDWSSTLGKTKKKSYFVLGQYRLKAKKTNSLNKRN